MKKLPLLIFASLFCLLFVNPQTQFAAVFPKSEAKIFTNKSAQNKKAAQTTLWQSVSEDSLDSKSRRSIAPEKYLVFRLSKTVLTELLAGVESEFTEAAREKSVIIELPMPDGSLQHFRIEESAVLEPDLAARFPKIKSYKGQGIEDASLTTRFDWTPQGFHALVLSGDQIITVEPVSAEGSDKSLYISYVGDDLEGTFECLVKDFQENSSFDFSQAFETAQIAVGTTRRNYRIAIATTFEYTQSYGGGTVAGTVSSLNTWLNGANLIYERELSIHLNLVNNTDVIYSADRGFTATTDPYDNANVGTMLDQVRPNLRDNVGEANYDLGHVLGTLGVTGGSGIAFVGVACSNSNYNSLGAIKGGGSTLLGGTVGNVTALGVWVHELGHQFGANHNFNGTLGNCSGSNRSAANSFETGSGSTIMGYSGTCGADNITNSRDMRFHAKSYEAINNYIADGGICFVGAATGNNPPTVNGGADFTIPKNTPFILTATGSDVNGDALTYNWEQIDAGGTLYPQNGTSASYTDAFDSSTTRPIFRPIPSTSSPSRTFPSLNYILNYSNDPPDLINNLQTAEELPRIGRTLNFRVTARDNRLNGGGVNDDSVVISVEGSSGPFIVTSLNAFANLTGNSTQTVTWSVNNTNVAPVNAANVKISLSTDGGQTFPAILAASTPNDGIQAVTLPNINSTTARIKIEALDNIFFDISDANFAIALQTTAASVSASGRVVTAQGRGITNVMVTMTDLNGAQRTAMTNSSGYFLFGDVAVGATYSFEARAKNYNFTGSAQVFNINEEIDDIKFVSPGRR